MFQYEIDEPPGTNSSTPVGSRRSRSRGRREFSWPPGGHALHHGLNPWPRCKFGGLAYSSDIFRKTRKGPLARTGGSLLTAGQPLQQNKFRWQYSLIGTMTLSNGLCSSCRQKHPVHIRCQLTGHPLIAYGKRFLSPHIVLPAQKGN